MDLEVANFFQKYKHFVRKKDMQLWILLFVPFHIKTSIAKHVELQNVVGALMDRSHDQKPRIHVVQNKLRSMELRCQLGLESQ
jgi:hypothetical protein